MWCAPAAAIAWSLPAEARDERVAIDVAATTLPGALTELSRETGISIGAAGPLPQVRSKAVHGRMTVGKALQRILAGTGLTARQVGPTAWRIERAGALPPDPATPRSSAPPPATSGPDIVVTGTKRRIPLDATPDSVAVALPGEVLGVRTGAGTAAVASLVEGLTVSGEGTGRNRIFLRGVSDGPFSGHSQSTVAVLFDDSRLTYAAPDPDLRLVDVERVEVLKGPQGSLYGTGALGGIYRVVSRRADPARTEFSASASAEAVTHGGVGFSGSAMANLPLVEDTAALRLVAYADQTPGWIDTGNRKDSNSNELSGFRANVGLEPDSDWRIDLTALGQWFTAGDSNYVYEGESYARPAQIPERHDNDLLHASFRAARDGEAATLLLASGYTRHEVNNRFDATQGATSFGLPDPQQLADDNDYTIWDNELRATGKWGRIEWLAGLSHLRATQKSEREIAGFSGATVMVDTDHRKAVETGLFGEGSARLSESLTASLGARVFRSLIEEYRAEGNASVERHLVRYGVTPSASLSWHPEPGRLVYLRYGSAFRQGGSGVSDDGEVETLDGDELATLTAGWRESRGPWRLDLGLYRSWWSSIQSDVLRSNGLIETANVGNGSIVGADMSVEADFGAGWQLRGGAMVQSAKIDLEDAQPGTGDRRLPVVPSSRFRAALAKEFVVADWDLGAALSLDYTGKARLSFDPALDRPMGNILTGNFALNAHRGRLSATLDFENLFNGQGDTFAYGNPLRIIASAQHVLQRPRSVRLSLTWR